MLTFSREIGAAPDAFAARTLDRPRPLETQLETANYPVRDVEVIEREPDSVELVATLGATSADPNELDAVVGRLDAAPFVEHASWTLRSPE